MWVSFLVLIQVSEEIHIRQNQQSNAHEGSGPEEQAFAFDHSEIDQKEPQSIKGVEDEEEEEQDVKDRVVMEP